jgi:hypothetical protein
MAPSSRPTTSVIGPSETSRDVRCPAAIGGLADVTQSSSEDRC